MKLETVVHLRFQIELVSGGRVSGSGGGIEIGGTVDANLEVLRDPITGLPYMPGSSIKGKLRSLAEKAHGRVWSDGGPCRCGQMDCPVCPLFGAHMKTKAASAPTRIVVRDAPLSAASQEAWRNRVQGGQDVLERKTENIVGRHSGTAEHPRTGERIPPGSRFDAHVIVQLYQGEGEMGKEFESTLANALGLLADASSLGASGSRGYGEVKIVDPRREEKAASAIRITFAQGA